MALVGENGAATFVILDREPLYDQDDIARIACDHAIAPADRNALWRVLEAAGRAYLDQVRLTRAARLVRIRQDLLLARRLSAQLSERTPEAGQIAADAASVGLSRNHLAALREGERRAGPAPVSCLDEVREVLAWLTEVYDAALEACQAPLDPYETWRRALSEFHTRTLARPWTGPEGRRGERFLADCQAVLADAEAGPAETGASPALKAASVS